MPTISPSKSIVFLFSLGIVAVWLLLKYIPSSAPSTKANQVVANAKELETTPPTIPVLKVIGQFNGTMSPDDIKGTMGFQLQLLEDFCRTQGYSLLLNSAESEDTLFQSLDNQSTDIALFDNPTSSEKLLDYIQGPDILAVKTQLIYRRGQYRPRAFEDLIGKHIVVNDNHRFRSQFQFLKKHYPQITFEFSKRSQEQLLHDIHQGVIDYSLIDSDVFLHKRSRYPRTKVAYDAFYPETINWLIAKNANEKLSQSIENYFDTIKSNGVFDHIKEEYFGHVNASKPLSSRTFFSRVNHRLPKYQDLIEQIAEKQGIDWRLLAAIAYQESHWDPLARSVTGVRGMMMLTRPTAKELGISNRLDTAASLNGGARYFLYNHARLEDSVSEPDRTWFALAAYNVGFGHLQDARGITDFHGDNPNRWADVKKYLPLLEKKEWYEFTRHGKARGSEPVKYVQYIRHFRDLLEWRFPMTKEEESLLSSQQPLSVPPSQVLEQKTKDSSSQSKPSSESS